MRIVLLFGAVPMAAGAAAPRERSWFEQVERDRDRGAGRVVDDATWETQRLQERRDERFGILEPSRGYQRIDEERERELAIERRARREQRQTRGLGTSAADQSAILGQPSAGLPTMAAVVAQDLRALADAQETLARSLRAVDVAEARELRLLNRRLTRESRPEDDEAREQVRQRFEALRARHRAAYEAVRQRIHANSPSR
jgi:hypothetical protein